ncbi:MAG TPA: helix-turn-helix domain-containing protein [Solirubrobacteraceae bacterium]|jgi:DNA-binding HxlR family transcriptional regulator|nr:helix-turn-helix domain-containing protein [Solirubrobacteraceae bacterium]
MLGNSYANQRCSMAAALEVVGERWSLLIVRDIMLDLRRFDEIQADLGVARNVLQARLERLVELGVIEKRLYQERPPRYEYRLTEKGLDLWPAMVSLMHWGDRHAAPHGPPIVLEHRGCGGAVDEHRICADCGARLKARDARAVPGPGADEAHPMYGHLKRRAAQRQVA